MMHVKTIKNSHFYFYKVGFETIWIPHYSILFLMNGKLLISEGSIPRSLLRKSFVQTPKRLGW